MVQELKTINLSEIDLYENLPNSLKMELREMYCQRMKKSERSFLYRLRKVLFSAPEQQIFKEFANKYNVTLYKDKSNKPDAPTEAA